MCWIYFVVFIFIALRDYDNFLLQKKLPIYDSNFQTQTHVRLHTNNISLQAQQQTRHLTCSENVAYDTVGDAVKKSTHANVPYSENVVYVIFNKTEVNTKNSKFMYMYQSYGCLWTGAGIAEATLLHTCVFQHLTYG